MLEILSEKTVFGKKESQYLFKIFVACVVLLAGLSLYFLKSGVIEGDSVSYVQSIKVLQGESAPEGFVPQRLLTTFLGLEIINLVSMVFGSVVVAWTLVNLFFYFLLNIFFYKVLMFLFESHKTAFIGGLFFASNYALVTFGLNYLMDVGGWTFYICSLLYVLKFSLSKKRKDIFIAALLIGIGGLFKEYAFLGFIPLCCVVFWEYKTKYIEFIKQMVVPSILAFLPITIVYLYIYVVFSYTYLDWLGTNQVEYVYSSRIAEYIKGLGTLFNILAFFVIGGCVVLWRTCKEIPEYIKVFLVSVGLSILPIFVWPAITQRILFIVVPLGIVVAGFFFKKYEKYFYWLLPALVLYSVFSFFTDSFILDFINLPF